MNRSSIATKAILAISAISFFYLLLLPALFPLLIPLSDPARIVIAVLLVAPLAFAMGMPFPTGLRAMANTPEVELPASEFGEPVNGDNAVEWAWAMNAAASVLGSVLAMVIAIHFGLNNTVACGAAAYLLSLMLFPTLAPRRS